MAKVGTLKPAIASVRKAEKVTLALSIDGTPYRNDYSLWIYPAADKEVAPSEDICVTDDLDAHLKYLTEGGKVLWFPSKDKHKDQTVGGLFQTDYWNYRMFRTIRLILWNRKTLLILQNLKPDLGSYLKYYKMHRIKIKWNPY